MKPSSAASSPASACLSRRRARRLPCSPLCRQTRGLRRGGGGAPGSPRRRCFLRRIEAQGARWARWCLAARNPGDAARPRRVHLWETRPPNRNARSRLFFSGQAYAGWGLGVSGLARETDCEDFDLCHSRTGRTDQYALGCCFQAWGRVGKDPGRKAPAQKGNGTEEHSHQTITAAGVGAACMPA